jgi:hypothetical protein
MNKLLAHTHNDGYSPLRSLSLRQLHLHPLNLTPAPPKLNYTCEIRHQRIHLPNHKFLHEARMRFILSDIVIAVLCCGERYYEYILRKKDMSMSTAGAQVHRTRTDVHQRLRPRFLSNPDAPL